MARDYKKGRRERESLIRELVVLGLGHQNIAPLTRWSEATIAKDIRLMGGLQAIAPNRPRGQEKVFAAVFQRYAELVSRNDPTDETQAEARMLAKWLCIDTKTIMTMIMTIVEALLRPAVTPELSPYVNLLEALFNKRPVPASIPLLDLQYLSDVAAKRRPAPKSIQEFVAALATQTVDLCREYIAPVWPANAKEHINTVLATLSPQSQDVLRLRFGLSGQEPKTWIEVGTILNFVHGAEEARSCETSALRLLRADERRERLIPLIKPLGNVTAFRAERDETLNQVAAELRAVRECVARMRTELDVALALTGQASSCEEATVASVLIAPILLESVNIIEWSKRVYGCLLNSSIALIWELVEKTEAQMLKIKNFGRKSLEEIKEELDRHGLKLGTVFPPAVRLRLKAATEAHYRYRVSR